MIYSKSDRERYLRSDAKAMGVNYGSAKGRIKASLTNPRWKLIKKLRYVEYYKNSKKGLLNKFLYLISFYNYKKYALKLGFSIPPNVCDEGLSLPHYGTIVISKQAKIGKNCRIHICVNIGASGGLSGAPKIGDNVYIGPGAKIFGDIHIGDNNYIGANAVVNKSFEETGIIIGGIPAKKLKDSETVWWKQNGLEL